MTDCRISGLRFNSLISFLMFDIGDILKKESVNKPQTLQELKENIRNKIRELNRNPEILQSVVNNVLERAQICKAENGQHLKDNIFHK